MSPSRGDVGEVDGVGSASEREALIALSLVPGVGPGRLRTLMGSFRTASEILRASADVLSAVPGIGPQTAGAIAGFDGYDQVAEQLRRAERHDAWMLPAWDPRFPPLLRQIYDPPAFLWVRGTLTAYDEDAVAVVGTRRPSSYGRRVAHELARELARSEWTVVSGLAYGIDAAAHRGALEGGGRTLAVLGSGLDRIYPGRHLELARAIGTQGAVLSEFPFGTGPDAQNFPRRNRIISGLSRGTLVVEAYDRGGALLTAHLALEQNREVFAVPGGIHQPSGYGSNRLIQRGGAKLVLDVDDMLVELDGFRDRKKAASATPPGRDPLTEAESQLYSLLEVDPIPLDTLCARSRMEVSAVLVSLLSMEFKGWVRQLAGKHFVRA